MNSALVDEKANKQMYHVFKMETKQGTEQLTEAISTGIQRNVNDITTNEPIPPRELSEEPGRFKVEDPLGDTKLGALAKSQGGVTPKTVKCDGAVWTAVAKRDAGGALTQVNACLWHYKDGYNLDIFMSVQEKEQGLIKSALTGAVGAALGNPEEWANRIAIETMEHVHSQFPDTKISRVEGRPSLDKDVTWLARQTH
jgi:hypothetical protein